MFRYIAKAMCLEILKRLEGIIRLKKSNTNILLIKLFLGVDC